MENVNTIGSSNKINLPISCVSKSSRIRIKPRSAVRKRSAQKRMKSESMFFEFRVVSLPSLQTLLSRLLLYLQILFCENVYHPMALEVSLGMSHFQIPVGHLYNIYSIVGS